MLVKAIIHIEVLVVVAHLPLAVTLLILVELIIYLVTAVVEQQTLFQVLQ
jgi:hypothetical protein